MTSTSAAPARPRRRKGEGQWALGYREPLNANEQSKKDDNPLNVRARIENIYAHRGFESIDGGDLRGRFRWWGLYTQRKAGIDGGRTATLEPEELDADRFMMRVRIDGGQLSLEQLRAIADVSVDFGRGTADVTDRQNIQFHWIDVRDVPTIWQRLESVGLSTQEACGDCPRVILGSPVAGVSTDEIIDGRPAIDAIESRYIGDQAFSNLPRKFKSAISGHPGHDVVPQINDVAFIGAIHPEHGAGFDVWVGGGLSTNPHLAKRLGAWVPLDEVPAVWEGIISIFRDYGYRRLRSRARLKFLVQDWGIEKFREVLETEYLERALIDLDAPPVPDTPVDHVGVHRQVDGRYYVGAATTVGRISGPMLQQLADVVEAHGSARIALTPMQKIIVLDVEEAQVESLVAALADLGLHARPSAWRQHTMACTGIEYCKLAIVNTKDRAAQLIDELEQRVPELDTPITVNVNGCPNSCARIQTADIGLKGQLVLDDDGRQVEGFQVHLGGALGMDAGFGRKLRAHKVTGDQLPDYVEKLSRTYLANRDQGESFARWVARADEELLR
ncbi:nitrite/sulfite reductase [Aeromicrobium sp. 636]|uniref:assimilatory sulfite reductase (ferredoxin) n=1 Tax=Aeromicrobium senzhongii TaxID=2663859 RepID=A0A8I0ETN1_9ACTN|nr:MULTISPECIES: nitrite/sulfite reductase [Aeromicrobium]MBC9225334.1 nitrite/sulfite reductase [Aeromicrobium senzhongii]MCQ3997444.1 nitrite/sulfite reductase [Aeromicrobium sp. 636]MTB87374.1 nitrite/sulfite reductase [Aeromicrobium senzhongii]QNL95568.1 nitrite/sulfite reductase [Aeromicrobium senzhongii]